MGGMLSTRPGLPIGTTRPCLSSTGTSNPSATDSASGFPSRPGGGVPDPACRSVKSTVRSGDEVGPTAFDAGAGSDTDSAPGRGEVTRRRPSDNRALSSDQVFGPFDHPITHTITNICSRRKFIPKQTFEQGEILYNLKPTLRQELSGLGRCEQKCRPLSHNFS
jgi:hypothetical protein